MSSNKFLDGSDGGISLSDLQNGSLSLYVNRLKTQGIVEAADYESKTTFSYNDEIQKIDNLEASTENNTNITGELHVTTEITVPKITDISGLSRIDLDDTDINVVSQNFTFNGENVLTTPDLNTLNTKTFHMDSTLGLDTKFNSMVISDGYILTNGPNPAQFLLSDGTSTILNDSEYIITNTPPFNSVTDITKSKGDVYYDTTSSSIYGFQPPFRDEPAERTLPTYSGTIHNVANEIQLIDALANLSDSDTINLIGSITLSSSKTITKRIKLTSDNGQRTLSFSSSTNILNFTNNDTLVQGLYFNNTNTNSSATCLSFTSTTSLSNYVQNCTFYTNEFAITTSNAQIQITDCYFYWTGTGDSHRYVALYKNTGSTIIARNTFQGNPTFNTACLFISGISGSSFINGSFVFKNNSTLDQFPVQRLCISDMAFGVNDNVKFWIHDNNIQSSSGFMIFYNTIPMTGVHSIIAYNNTETLGGTATGSKGIIACDNISATTLPGISGKPYITTFNNTQPALRADYIGWTSDNNVAYNNTVITTVGNTPKKYSAVLQDVIGGNVSEKTANIVLPLEANGTRFLNNLYADKFIIQGGPSPAGYLMSDGTILNSSSGDSNSNIYLYNNSNITTAPPSNGQIRFNNAAHTLTTEIYISHLTRNGLDVDPFLALISQLSVIYIQTDNDHTNYVKFNVNSSPIITPNSYFTVLVTFLEGGGTGLTNFSNGQDIFLSIFSNDVEIDTRISNVETKTQNISANSSTNTINKSTTVILDNFGNFIVRDDALNPLLGISEAEADIYETLNMNNNRITGVGAPSANSDATTKSYVDAQDALKLNLDGSLAMTGALNMNTTNKIINLGAPTLSTDATTKNYVDTQDALKLNLSGGTMSGILSMGGSSITNAFNITANQAITGNTIVKSGGTSSQILLANGGTLTTTTYPTITSSSFSATFPAGTGGTPATVTINVRKSSDGTRTLVTLIIPQILVTMGNPAITLQTSAPVLSTDLRPAVITYLPIPIRNGGTYTTGLIWIYGNNGYIGFSDMSGASYFTSGSICGVNFPTQITYAI